MKNKILIDKKMRGVYMAILACVVIFVFGVGVGVEISKNFGNDVSALKNSEKLLANSPKDGELVKVTRVIDGDTIETEGGERVRYIGIDTPETVDPRKSVQCFGVEASKKNKELVEGKMVRLEKDVTDRDKYNRLLRYIWLDDVLINKKLVEEGFAHSYSYPPDVKYQAIFVEAEKDARDSKNGLWSACPLAEGKSEGDMPPQASSLSQVEGCDIKGNISTLGDKIYHTPGCGSYTKTSINESLGEKWFCSEAEAESAGWRKALNCN